MNLVLKVTFDNYDEWRAEFDSHEARAEVCDESKTTVEKIDDKSCIVMLLMLIWKIAKINEF